MLNEGHTVSAADLVTECRKRLAAYKVPKNWVILADPSLLPYTTTNKIDKARLTALMATGELS